MGKLIELLKPKYMPIAIYRAKNIPDYAETPGEDHCIVGSMLIPAFNGRTIAAKKEQVGCRGGWNGLGFGGEDPENRNKLMIGYSSGNDERPGRYFFCSPETAKKNYQDKVPVYGDGNDAIVFQPMDQAEKMYVQIEVVCFLVNPLELSALITMASFFRDIDDSVIRSSFALSCEQVYAMARQEGEKVIPRMVLGTTEFFTRRFIDEDRMTISMPYKLYKSLDEDCEYSFLKDDRWREAAKPKKCDKCC